MHRRTFMKLVTLLGIPITHFSHQIANPLHANHQIASVRGYGMGTYGQGIFPGKNDKAIYLPLITKKEN